MTDPALARRVRAAMREHLEASDRFDADQRLRDLETARARRAAYVDQLRSRGLTPGSLRRG